MIGISVQVSLYPLNQNELKTSIDKALRIFIESESNVTPGPMSTIISGDEDKIFAALQEAFHNAASDGQVVMVATFSNACPVELPS